ncbi:MAG: PilZ domain-containing protein [Candidatus Omnitrophica bacterium]|nr:PilZ domain-containing protein [Candidatus Omnitrophota bacterium]
MNEQPPVPPLSSSGSGIERRQFPRIGITTKVQYSVVIPSIEHGTTKDISQGGLCLECNRKLALGTILRLEFDLPGNPPEHIEALGRVMWQRVQGENVFLTGIKFLT